MPISPDEDKTAFWERIRRDPWIDKTFGLTGKSDADAAVYIRKQKHVGDTELTDKSRFILIFNPPSNEALSPYEYSIMEVDVLVPASRQYWADEVLQQIVALCGENNEDKWKVNGKTIVKTAQSGDLSAAAGYYRTGIRIWYYSCVETKKKTI